MSTRALVSALALTALIVLGNPQQASAHASLVTSDPVRGSIVDALPDSVTLTFDEAVEEPAFVTVTAPDGKTYDTGDPIVVDAQVTQPLSFGDDEGTYTVAFRIASFDGHPVTDTFTFSVGHPSQAAPSVTVPGPAASSDGSFIADHVTSLTIAMAAITLAICLAILKASRSRHQQGDA